MATISISIFDPIWDQWTTGTSATSATTSTAWTRWSSDSTISPTSVDVWTGWVTATGTAGTASNVTITAPWSDWVENAYVVNRVRIVSHPQPTAQEAEATRQRIEMSRLKKKDAKEKALALLRGALDQKQLEDLKKHNYFYVRSPSGKLYRIDEGRAGNVKLVDENKKRIKTYCAHPREYVPNHDTMLVQKIMLEHKEKDFLRIANVH